MSNLKLNVLASLALLAGAPVVAQAAMVEMAETDMADVNGQGIIGDTFSAVFGALTDPFIDSGSTTSSTLVSFVDLNANGLLDAGDEATYVVSTSSDGNYLPATIADAIGGAAGDATQSVIGFGLLPFTGPFSALGAFNGQILGNSAEFGAGLADIAFYGPFRALELAGNILAAPVNFVFNPLDRALAGVTGRFEATVDGAAYAVTEVKGALIANAFAGASQGAANNGLNFTSRVFGRISQAQAGLTANRLADLSGKYGY